MLKKLNKWAYKASKYSELIQKKIQFFIFNIRARLIEKERCLVEKIANKWLVVYSFRSVNLGRRLYIFTEGLLLLGGIIPFIFFKLP